MRRRVFRVGLLIGSMFIAWGVVASIALLVVGFIRHGDTALASPQSAVSLKDAIDHVRAFSEDPSLDLHGGLAPAAAGDDTRPVYWLESGDGEQVDEFKVDGISGEVLEATFRSRLRRSASDRRASIEDAALIASNFGGKRFKGFNDLTLLERSTLSAQDVGPMFSLKWVQVDPATGAELPTSVTVSVASANSRVVRYLAQRDPVEIDTSPKITADQAATVALSTAATDRRWRDANIASRRLQVIYDEVNHQRLAWAILLDTSSSAADSRRLLMLVDARTSELIETD